MSHKANCAVYDPVPDTCDCGYTQSVVHSACNKRIAALETQCAAMVTELVRVRDICLAECGTGIVNEVVLEKAKRLLP